MSGNKILKYDQEDKLLARERVKPKRPFMYNVVLLNDDYTPREFVVRALIKIFYKSEHESLRIMLDAHTKGKSIVGVYTHDVARTKVIQVDKLADKNGHPLKCIIVPQEGGEH